VPAQETRLAFVKLCLELELFTPALLVLQGVIAGDDQDVEAWYLEGWAFFLMAEHAREAGGARDGLAWEDLARDARDCLETCHVVRSLFALRLCARGSGHLQLHTNQEHPDQPMLEHAQELVAQLDALGIQASPVGDAEDEEGEEWEDDSDEEDVDMS
jgi:hypothetical protein